MYRQIASPHIGSKAMRRPKQPRPGWPGELGKPIKWKGPKTFEPPLKMPLLGIEMTEEEKQAHREAWYRAAEDARREQFRKIRLLAERYNIGLQSECAILSVLISLAAETVPGFDIDFGVTRPGRRATWTDSRHAELLADVEAEKRRRKCGDSEACRVLVTSKRYRERYGQGEGSSEKATRSLNSRLVEARNSRGLAVRLVQQSRDARERELHVSALIVNFALDLEAVAAAQRRIGEIWESMAPPA